MKISVITVTYNSEKTLGQTIESVLSQDYSDYEYIVVDGGSNDSTIDVISKYSNIFNGKLKYISERDNGLYDAMNKGINMATGDVVGMLNSDDYYTSNDILSTIAHHFSNDISLDAVYADVHYIKDSNPNKCVRYYSSRFFRPFFLRLGFMPAHPSFYARRNIYDKVGGYKLDYRIGADYEMMVRMYYGANIKSEYINKDFVTMRMGGLSTKNINSIVTLIKEDVRACKENGVYTNYFMICMKFIYKFFSLRI